MDIKESIIKSTTELIQQNGGDLSAVTSRAIAEKCGIALGLINYHFKSKDKLIEICVQRIVNKILFCFYSDEHSGDDISDRDRVLHHAQKVFDFFFQNKAMAKTFILSDMKNYKTKSNTAAVQCGLKLALKKTGTNNQKRLLSYMLTSVMETAFLTDKKSTEALGYNLDNKLERDMFLTEAVDMVYNGIGESL